jgi:hypothetical protein
MKVCRVEQPQSDRMETISSKPIDWDGIVVEHYQAPANCMNEQTPAPLLAHWLSFPSVQPMHLVQQHG